MFSFRATRHMLSTHGSFTNKNLPGLSKAPPLKSSLILDQILQWGQDLVACKASSDLRLTAILDCPGLNPSCRFLFSLQVSSRHPDGSWAKELAIFPVSGEWFSHFLCQSVSLLSPIVSCLALFSWTAASKMSKNLTLAASVSCQECWNWTLFSPRILFFIYF